MDETKMDGRLAAYSSAATRMLSTRLLAIDAEGGLARFGFTATPAFANELGYVQGGLIAAMLDETAGLTARILTERPLHVPTLDFRVSFYAAAPLGDLLAIGRVIRIGRRVAFIEADLLGSSSDLLARMSVTSLAQYDD
jgi:uncharacterized protein (TIGR00369 family)